MQTHCYIVYWIYGKINLIWFDLKTFGGCAFGAQLATLGKDFELILTVKIETGHTVGGPLSREFPAFVIYCGVMMAWSRKTWKMCEQFLFFFLKITTPCGKILFQTFTRRHRSTLLCWNVVKFVRREIGETVRYSHDKKTKFRLPLKLSIVRGSRPKPARASHQHLSYNFPNFIQIGSLSAEL